MKAERIVEIRAMVAQIDKRGGGSWECPYSVMQEMPTILTELLSEVERLRRGPDCNCDECIKKSIARDVEVADES